MAEAEGRDTRIEEPEAFAARLLHAGDDVTSIRARVAGEVRARDEQWQAVAAEARRDVLAAWSAQECPLCRMGWPLHADTDGDWWHSRPVAPHQPTHAWCDAVWIWILAAGRGWLPAPAEGAREEV